MLNKERARNIESALTWGRRGDNKSMHALGQTDRLAQLVEHGTAVREVAGSNLGRTKTQGL